MRRAKRLGALLSLALALRCAPGLAGSDGGIADGFDRVSPSAATSDGGIAGVVDPVSMPAFPPLAPTDVPSAASCGACHPRQLAEWQGSRHADAMSDRVFQALVSLRQRARQGKEDRFCVQCHGVVGVRSGDVHPGFDFASLSPTSMDGVSCAVCHGADAIVRPNNAGLSLPIDGVVRGGLADPATGGVHHSVSAPHLATSLFCASCHDVYELRGLSLERPYEEWLSSPAASPGMTCQDCHMPLYDGKAANGGPDRKGLRSHRFVGFDPPGARTAAEPETRAAFAADLQALLGSAARMEIHAGDAAVGETLDVVVSVENRIAGHSLPTGSTFVRQCWIELRVTDDAGRAVYESGTLDGNGDLRDRWSSLEPYGDPDLVALSSQLLDQTGEPALFPWEAAEHRRNALRAGETRTFTYFVPVPADAQGTLHFAARLRMRPAPPFLLRLLGLDELLPLDDPRDLANASGASALR
jgi:hypothetical protein